MVLLPITLALIGALWFILIRPQQQRLREQQAMVQALEVGDQVITTAGIYATVTALEDDVATLEIAPGVEIRSARAAIGRLVVPVSGSAGADADPDAAAGTPDDADPDAHADPDAAAGTPDDAEPEALGGAA